MQTHSLITTGMVCATALTIAALITDAGPLMPPAGPVAGTGRTQIFALPFTISQPGSYIVARDLTGVAGQNGITIATNGVTLDLGGFTLHGVPGSLNGIDMGFFLENVVIQNGAVRDWGGSGVQARIDVGRIERISATNNAGWGIDNNSGAFTGHIVSCEAIFNGASGASGGIRVGNSAVVTGCVSRFNNGAGVLGGTGVTVENTTSASNNGPGFLLGDGAAVRGCTASLNLALGAVQAPPSSRPDFDNRRERRFLSTTSGAQAPPSPDPGFVDPFADYVDPVVIDERTGEVIPGLVNFGAGTEGAFTGSDGFRLGFGSTIEGCSAVTNADNGIAVGRGSTVVNCSASTNAGSGIVADDDSTVQSCTSQGNGGDGVIIDADGVVRDCTANNNNGAGIVAGDDGTIFGNKVEANGANGIIVNGNGCRVDSNHVAVNLGDGILLNFNFTVVVRNHLEIDNINDVFGGNTIGPFNDLTNPWTNFNL